MAANPIERVLAMIVRPPVAQPVARSAWMAPPRVIAIREDAPIVMQGRITSETESGPRSVQIGMSLIPLGEMDQSGAAQQVTFSLPQRVGNRMRRGEKWEIILRRIDDDED